MMMASEAITQKWVQQLTRKDKEAKLHKWDPKSDLITGSFAVAVTQFMAKHNMHNSRPLHIELLEEPEKQ